MYYLTERDVLTVLAAVGEPVEVRDFGLLASAVARPRASAFGEDAYPDPWVKAAALMQSLGRNDPFVDGNERASWNAAWTFLEANEIGRLDPAFDVDAAERLVLSVASGDLDDLAAVATALQGFAV